MLHAHDGIAAADLHGSASRGYQSALRTASSAAAATDSASAMTSRTTSTVTTTDPRSSSAIRESRENVPSPTTMGSSQSSAEGKAFEK